MTKRPATFLRAGALSIVLLLAGLAVVAIGCARAGAGSPHPIATSAFVGVNVVPMDDETILRDQTVLVRDGMITAVGPRSAVVVPSDARRIDGRTRYLMPGLIDSHVHLRSTDELISYLAHGVTTILHLSGPTSGAPDLAAIRRSLESGELPGPRLFFAGRILDGDPPIFPGVSVAIETAAAARAEVARQDEAGVDFIKLYNRLPAEAVTAAVSEAHARGLVVFGHVPRAEDRENALQRALQAGLDVIAHSEEYFWTFFHAGLEAELDAGVIPTVPAERIPEAVALTLQSGTLVIPNLSFVRMTRRQLDDMAAVLADPEARYLTPQVRRMWESANPTTRQDLARFDRRERARMTFLPRLTRALHLSGVPLLLGSDASAPGMFPGASAHLELHELVAAGLSPYEALRTGTSVPGAYLAQHVSTALPAGRVEPGRTADLVMLAGNPLEDISGAAEIVGVMRGGRWYPDSELARVREDLAAARGP